jgi:hypothetical protein
MSVISSSVFFSPLKVIVLIGFIILFVPESFTSLTACIKARLDLTANRVLTRRLFLLASTTRFQLFLLMLSI